GGADAVDLREQRALRGGRAARGAGRRQRQRRRGDGERERRPRCDACERRGRVTAVSFASLPRSGDLGAEAGASPPQRAVWASRIAASTTVAPASCAGPSASPSQAQATTVATTGSAIAAIATRVADRWRSAPTSSTNGTIVPSTTM